MTEHHVRRESVHGWSRWKCEDCDWSTRLVLFTLPWDEAAAREHEAQGEEDDP